jgi:hypothetical protein
MTMMMVPVLVGVCVLFTSLCSLQTGSSVMHQEQSD